MGEISWGEMVSTIRALLELTQAELAEKAGVERTVLARQEEEVSSPNPKARQKIEEALGLAGVMDQVRRSLTELKEKIEGGGSWMGNWSLEEVEEAGARLFESAMRVGVELLKGEARDPEGVSWGVFSATLRRLRGWSQGDLEKATGIRVKALSRLEGGHAQVSEANRERIEMALVGETGLAAKVVRMQLGGLRAMLKSPRYPAVEEEIRQGREIGRRFLQRAVEVGVARAKSPGGVEEEGSSEGLRESLLWF